MLVGNTALSAKVRHQVRERHGRLTRVVTLVCVAGALIFTAASFVACGSKGGKLANTPSRVAATAQLTPSPTAPVATATPTAAPQISSAEASQIRANVKGLIAAGLRESGLVLGDENSDIKISQAGASLEVLDADVLAKSADECDMAYYGQTIVSPGYTIPNHYNGPPVVQPERTIPAEQSGSAIFQACLEIPHATKALYKATGDNKFKEANEDWQPLHKQVFDDLRAKDPRIAESTWEGIILPYYNLDVEITPQP